MDKKNYLYAALSIIVIVVSDIYTKFLVVYKLGAIDRLEYLGGLLKISLVYNQGGVFGIAQGYKNFFLVVSVVVLILMVVYFVLEKNKTALFTMSMALIVSGAVGNIIDRVIPGRPGVVDFISVGIGSHRWPSFNIADSSIVVGAFLLILVFYTEEKKRKKLESPD